MALGLATVTRPLDWQGGFRLEDLNLWEGPHVYTHTPTGRRLLSVTQVMRDNALGFDPLCIDATTLEVAQFRGRFVHRSVQLHVAPENGARLDLDALAKSHADLAAYVESYIRRAESERLRVTHAEHKFYDWKFWYAGTLDQVGMARSARRKGIELKTGGFTHAEIQVGAYAQLWKLWHPALPIDEWEVWRLRADGLAADVTPVDISEGFHDFAAALRLTLRRIAVGRTLAPDWARVA